MGMIMEGKGHLSFGFNQPAQPESSEEIPSSPASSVTEAELERWLAHLFRQAGRDPLAAADRFLSLTNADPTEAKRLLRLLPHRPSPGRDPRGDILTWLATQTQGIEIYADDYIAVDHHGVLAFAPTLDALVAEVERLGIQDKAVMYRVPQHLEADLTNIPIPITDDEARTPPYVPPPSAAESFLIEFLWLIGRHYEKAGLFSKPVIDIAIEALTKLKARGEVPDFSPGDSEFLIQLKELLDRIGNEVNGPVLDMAVRALRKHADTRLAKAESKSAGESEAGGEIDSDGEQKENDEKTRQGG